MDNTPVLNPERQKQAKAYSRISRRLMVLDLLIGFIYCLAWLVFGWSVQLRTYLTGFTSNEWLLVAGFALVFGGIFLIINLPLSIYEGYILPHRFGTSTQSGSGWIVDQFKSLLLGGILGGLVLEIVYAILRLFPETWWLWASVFLIVFNVLLANLAPIILFPIFNKFTPLGEEHAGLVERLLLLTKRTHTHVQGVYQFDMSRRTTAANAALTGLGNTRRIILGDTLLQEFTADEIETVMAHELGHHVHRDIPLSILFQSLLTLFGLFLAGEIVQWGVTAFNLQSVSDIAGLPMFILVVGGYGLITTPIGNAFSRWRERMADEFALELTGNGKAYASALVRLANQNLAEVDPEPWVEWLLYSHPALNKRIAMAQSKLD